MLRGGFRPTGGDGVPALPNGKSATVLWLVGIAGSTFWPHFKQSEYYRDGLANPLDRWSAAIGDALAERYAGLALYPFRGPPFYPFHEWASRAEPLERSPLGLLLHPQFGLWHAYRFALALPSVAPGDINDAVMLKTVDVCLQCSAKPCLSACPVDAFDGIAYNSRACIAHVRGPDGSRCLQAGCLARGACPAGTAFHYVPEHAAFHMRHFAGVDQEDS
jgi:ferredoxin